MKKYFSKAVENFANSINAKFDECKNPPEEGFISKIQTDGDIKKSVYIFIPKKTLDTISMLLFGDCEYDVEDLVNEVANLIVGNAKVVASEDNVHFNISTPQFLDIKNIKYKKREDYGINGECLSILY